MALGWRGSYLRYRDFFLNVLAVYKTRRDLKIFLEIILSASASSFFLLFAIRPTLLTITDLLSQVRSKNDTLSKMSQKALDLQKAQNLFSQETRITLIESAVPNDPAIESFVGQAQALAKTHSLKIQALSIGEIALVGNQILKAKDSLTPLPNGAKALSFSVSLTGDYPSLRDFISDLERMRRPVKVDSIAINSSKTGEQKILVLVISGRSPYLEP